MIPVDEGCVMLLEDEAHLSVSSNISTMLACAQSTIYCQSSISRFHPCNDTTCSSLWWGTVLERRNFSTSTADDFYAKHSSLMSIKRGLQRKRENVPAPQTETAEMCSICPNLIPVSGVYTTHPQGMTN